MAELHTIFGDRLNENGSNPEVIAELESLLEQARRGDVICLACAFLDSANFSNTSVVGSSGHTAGLGGAIGMLQHRYFANWREQS